MGQVKLQDILFSYGIRITKFTNKGGKIHCPFHDDKTPSCSVDLQRNVFYCFPCGQGGGIIKFVMLKEQVDRDKAYEILRRRFNVKFHQNYQKSVEQEQAKIQETFEERLKLGIKFCEMMGFNPFDGKHNVDLFGMLLWLIDKDAKSRWETNKYYVEYTKKGKMERTLQYLQWNKCYGLLHKIKDIAVLDKDVNKQATKLHKQKDESIFDSVEFWNYREQLQLISIIEEQMWIREDFGFRAVKDEDIDAFKVLKDSWFELYAVLWDMVQAGKDWPKLINEIDWMKP